MSESNSTESRSPVAVKGVLHDAYFVQKVRVGRELMGRSRVDVFAQLCSGRRVLHVGCTDWPITDPACSLHVELDKYCAKLDGFDVHPEQFEVLAPHVRGAFFSDWSEVNQSYDLMLVPEVLEHVADVQGFLQQLSGVDVPHVVMTVPDAYSCFGQHFEYRDDSEMFSEVVHPDHNCWYTPYTFCNVIAKYTDWAVDGVWFFNRISLLAILSKPKKGDSQGGRQG
ncbi:hypothetical protein [Aquabacterium sp.]|uniref:hypothetical protein n=1 Tax=Aquabacterium sp. TaxID=1872578 RepID=UPI0035B2324A